MRREKSAGRPICGVLCADDITEEKSGYVQVEKIVSVPRVDVSVGLFQTEEEPSKNMVDGDVTTTSSPPAFNDSFVVPIEFDVLARERG